MSPLRTPTNDTADEASEDAIDAPGSSDKIKRAKSVLRLKESRTVTNLKKQFNNMQV